jgi:hypothetical protein
MSPLYAFYLDFNSISSDFVMDLLMMHTMAFKAAWSISDEASTLVRR